YSPIQDPVYQPAPHDGAAGWEPGAPPAREPRPSQPAPPRAGPESWPAAWEDNGYTHDPAQRPNPPRAGADAYN
ncbi:MAG TPA: hypothetical protein VFY89_06510, partial [Ktedonobacterales bacterium]